MKKKIIIAEKPSVAAEYAKVLGVFGDKKKGYMENDEWIVTWTIGHLITMSYPDKYNPAYKEWKLDTLPFLPDQFRYEVISSVKSQFDVVKKLYNRDDISCIFYAGDSGREGLYIQMLVRMMAGHNARAQEKVVWIDSQTEDEILRGINEAKDVKEYDNLSDAGYMRAEEDYLVGINFSRLLSLLYSAMVNTGSGQSKPVPISIGRVMTCVLGMVVRREREIRNFVPVSFYRVGGKIGLNGSEIECEWRVHENSKYYNSPNLYSNYGFLCEDDAKALIRLLSDSIKIEHVEKCIEKKNAPLLYNLAELQGDCTKYFHISPSESLSIVQSLYEKKLTTYPRTDARVLSSAVAKEIGNVLVGLKNSSYCFFIQIIQDNKYSLKNRYVDDSKITDHYAIIPTGNCDSLSGNEALVYDLIVKRFLSVFYPPAEYEKVKFEGKSNGELFVGSSKYLLSEGFYSVVGIPNEKQNNKESVFIMKNLVEGSLYSLSCNIKEGFTEPPKRYTSGSMILAMENAGNLIEDDELREMIKNNGIGTSATRAETIEKLLRLSYIVSDKKEILSPTLLGEMIYEVVDYCIPDFLVPNITAEWERRLNDIASGSLSRRALEADLYEYVRKICDCVKTKGNEGINEVYSRIKGFADHEIKTTISGPKNEALKAKCPLCGDSIVKTPWGFKCNSNKSKTEGCDFFMGLVICGVKIKDSQVEKLFSLGKTDLISGFKSKDKSKKPFSACLFWDKTEKKIKFQFDNNRNFK